MNFFQTLERGKVDTDDNVTDQENAGPSPAKKKRTKTTEIQLENAPQDEVAVKYSKLRISYLFCITLCVRCILYFTRRGLRSERRQRNHRGDHQIRRRESRKESEVASKSLFEQLRSLKTIVVSLRRRNQKIS